jgi:hypothetical protein
MHPDIDYYRILQVQPDAHAAVIRASYRALMQTLRQHPDLGGDPRRAALINEAFAVLGDAAARERYDASRGPGLTLAVADGVEHCPFCIRRRSAGPGPCTTCGAPGVGAQQNVPGDTAGSEDSRRLARIRHDAPVHFLSRWPQPNAHLGSVVDLSPRGMRLCTEVAVPDGALLLLRCGVLQALARVLASSARAQSPGHELRTRFERVCFSRRQGGFVRITI